MKEVVLGIVTKGANTDEDKKSEFTKPTLMSPDVAVNMPEAELRDLARVYNVENCEKMKLDKLREVMKGILSKKQTENKANE
jgi:Ca2+-binding EF-hand superfamily protein